MNIGDVFFVLRGDGGQLTIDAQKAGEAAGAKAGASFSQKYGSQVKRAAGAALGAGVGLAFGVAAKGAAELDAAMRQFQADTGATAEEAKAASHAIAGMYRDNLQGFDQIGAALSKVHTDLGLTGQEAEKVTAQFLKFGTATGQDAADAVSGLDDILDAWNLTAAETPRILDLLVASHQAYGGSIADNQDALGALAPAMQALGADVDDTVGLLNLFAASGIDASKATAALNKAVAKLKPGQTLDDLIRQVSSIEDPTLRAQKAIEIFGAKGGVSLANALKPGVNSLRDFVPAADEVTGATERAADAIESSFGNQFKLILKNAGGALAEFGNNFGPLLMVAAQLGPKTIGAITAGIGGLIGRLIPSLVASGTAQGVAMGGAAAAAEVATQTTGVVAGQAAVATAAAPAAAASGTLIGRAMGLAAAAAVIAIPITIAITAAIIGDQVLEGIKNDIESKTKEAIADGSVEGLEAVRANLRERVRIAQAAHISGPMLDSLVRQLDEVDRALLNPRAGRAPQTGGKSPDERDEALGRSIVGGVAPPLTAMQRQLHDDLVKAIETIKTSNDPKAISEAIAAVLKSVLGGVGSAESTKALVAELTAKRDAALARGDKATADLFAAAIARIEPFAKGRQWQQEQIAAARKVVDSNKSTADKVAALKGIQSDLLSHQRTMAAGIVAQQIKTIAAIDKLPTAIATALGSGLQGLLRPGATINVKEDRGGAAPNQISPNPDRPRTATAQQSPNPDRRATGGRFRAREPIIVGELRPELLIPDMAGTILPSVPGGSAGGNTYNVAVQGLIRAPDPFEVATQLRRLASFGVLTPRRVPA